MRFCGWEIPVESVDRDMIMAWYNALTEIEESGAPRYPQTRGGLEVSAGYGRGFCCLGVLCRVVMDRASGMLAAESTRSRFTIFSGECDPTGEGAASSSTVLPYAAMKAAGFIAPYGEDHEASFAAEKRGRFENPPIIWLDSDGTYRPISCAQANDSLNLSFAEIAEAIQRTYLEPWTEEMQAANRRYEEYWLRMRSANKVPAASIGGINDPAFALAETDDLTA